MKVNKPLLPQKISLEINKKDTPIPQLSRYEIVKGKVARILAPGKAALVIKGRYVTAKSFVPLSEGKVVLLRVEETVPTPILKLIGTEVTKPRIIDISSILSSVRENIWKEAYKAVGNLDLPQSASSRFRELVDYISVRLFCDVSPDLLRVLIEKLGLRWESKLGKLVLRKGNAGVDIDNLVNEDLKGLGSRLLALKPGETGVLKRFVSALENFQLLNQAGVENERKMFFPIPIQFPDGPFTVGQLLVRLPEEWEGRAKPKNTEETSFTATFLLELSNLGPFRADLVIRGRTIGGKILVTRYETKLVIERNLPLFIRRMNETGFSVQYMECLLKAPDAVKKSLINEIISEEDCSLSLIA